MAEMQKIFTPVAKTIKLSSVGADTFFEYAGNLYYKVNDDQVIKFDDEHGVLVESIGSYNDLDEDIQVVLCPAGTGVTLMQSA